MSGVVGAQLVGRMWPFVGYLSDRSRNTASRLRLHGEARWLTADSDDNRGLDAAVGRAISDDACVRWYEVTSSLSVCLSVCPPAGGVTGVLAAPGGGQAQWLLSYRISRPSMKHNTFANWTNSQFSISASLSHRKVTCWAASHAAWHRWGRGPKVKYCCAMEQLMPKQVGNQTSIIL